MAARRKHLEISDAEFVEVWQTSPNAVEAAQRMGLDRQRARDRAAYLRRLGVNLRRMPFCCPTSATQDVRTLSAIAEKFSDKVNCWCGERVKRSEWDEHRAEHARSGVGR